jgi:serine/threonine protein phosphatase PrpC
MRPEIEEEGERPMREERETARDLGYEWRMAWDTDIGGSRENQDDCFYYIPPSAEGFVAGVLDGHGKEVGKAAANAATQYMYHFFERYYEELYDHPYETMVRAFYGAHQAIKKEFKDRLGKLGWEVEETPEGYLTKRRGSMSAQLCIHGGTSCSITALVGGRLIIANVGDSDIIMGVEGENELGDLREHVGDAAYECPFDLELDYMAPVDSPAATKRRKRLEHQRLQEAEAEGREPSIHPLLFVDRAGEREDGSGHDSEDSEQRGGFFSIFKRLSRDEADDEGGKREEDDESKGGGEEGEEEEGEFVDTLSLIERGEPKPQELVQVSFPPFHATKALVMNADHSPENKGEYLRLRQFYPLASSPSDRPRPALHIVYDSPSHEKHRCPPCFVENDEGEPELTDKGRYYKNVRREWASLVSTPSYAKYNDALAFTRSLGDFHLHHYGVSASPEVLIYDLEQHLPSLSFGSKVAAILLSSDGVWDNWTYEDCMSYLLDTSCLNLLRNPSKRNPTKKIVTSFMKRNKTYANHNFGSQADNATSILVYLWKRAPGSG